jgi:hypothetical protein
MIDYSALLYDPVYGELGVDATLIPAGTAGEIALIVIDDTRPKTITSGNVEARSMEPGAFVRMTELIAKGLAPKDYVGAAISFNGRSWMVRSHELTGSPNGEDYGEVRLLLKAIGSTSG